VVTLSTLIAIIWVVRIALSFTRLAQAWPKVSRAQRAWMIDRLLYELFQLPVTLAIES